MIKLNIKSLETDLTSNITTVTVELFETNGIFTKLKETLRFDLVGRYTSIDEALTEKVTETLTANGITL